MNRVEERLPRMDVPADWVSFVVAAHMPCYIEPIFTRDPALITEIQNLMAMMVIKGIYEPYAIAPQPRHRLRQGRHRTDPADLCKASRPPGAKSAVS